MRKLITLAIFGCCFVGLIQAQQDAQYTQFMFNKQTLNAAYVVVGDDPCISCLHRSQWVGLEGAPISQSLNFRLPIVKKNIGFGVSVNRDVIGPSESISGSLIYAYQLDFKKGKLGIGLQGTLRSYKVNWDNLTSVQSGDGGVPMGISNQALINFGAGVYYYTPKYYIGLSVPHFIPNDLSQLAANTNINTADFSKENLHSYLMAGILLNINDNIRFKPAVLLKYAANSPFDADINTSFIFNNRFWLGLSYRLGGFTDSDFGESIDAIFQCQITNALKIGLAYDFTLSKVRSYQSGTYEISVEYCLAPKDRILTNPRFF